MERSGTNFARLGVLRCWMRVDKGWDVEGHPYGAATTMTTVKMQTSMRTELNPSLAAAFTPTSARNHTSATRDAQARDSVGRVVSRHVH